VISEYKMYGALTWTAYSVKN